MEPENHAGDWARIVTPRAALHLLVTGKPGFSKLGGCPDVPAGFAWPMRAARPAGYLDNFWGKLLSRLRRREPPVLPERPLAFVAQIDVAEVARRRHPDFADCPAKGVLYFFYNEDENPWSVTPSVVESNGWRVVYLEDPGATQPMRPPPCRGKAVREYQERFLTFRPITSWPLDPESDAALDRAGLDEGAMEEYWEFTDTFFNGKPQHQLFGHATPVQGNEMEEECQRDAFRDSSLAGDLAGEARWRLLLQVDSDEQFNWGDAGKLYFWIGEDDLRKHRFDRVRLIMQCG